ADRTAGAADIVDDDGLAEQAGHALGQHAGDRIGRPTGRSRHDHGDGPRRPGLRRGAPDEHRDSGAARGAGQQSSARRMHGVPPATSMARWPRGAIAHSLAGMKDKIDNLLKDAVARGDVPGVVALATDARGKTYEGAFGKRVLGQPADMTTDTVVRLASM